MIAKKLENVKSKILVLSGKGGVGKSTFTSQLSFYLSRDEETEVGVLDVDICGPSIPKIMGCEGESVHQSNLGWEPVYVEDNLAVMSVGFLLDSSSQAVIWRGPKKNSTLALLLFYPHSHSFDQTIPSRCLLERIGLPRCGYPTWNV